MVGGTLMGYLGGLHYWWPKISGRLYPEFLAKLSAGIIFLGFNLTFFPQFILGYLGMPRRYHAYPPEFQVLNVLSSAGASILGVGYLIPMAYLMWSLRYGRIAGSNPWGASGLEWTTTSPPPTENFVGHADRHRGAVHLSRARGGSRCLSSRISSTASPSRRRRPTLGMWVFLVTEVLFFGGLFCTYCIYRLWYPAAFAAASREMLIWAGATNTAVLITSSLTMALAVHAAQTGNRRAADQLSDRHDAARGRVPRHQGVRVLHRDRRASRARRGVSVRAADPPAARAAVLLAVFRDDRAARAAHDHRPRHHVRDVVVVVERHDHRGSTPPRSRSAACTGTSSTSSGFFCFRCCI